MIFKPNFAGAGVAFVVLQGADVPQRGLEPPALLARGLPIPGPGRRQGPGRRERGGRRGGIALEYDITPCRAVTEATLRRPRTQALLR